MVRAPKEPACLQAALDYLSRGWSPIPLCSPDHKNCGQAHAQKCKRPGKAPVIKDWQTKRLTEKDLRNVWRLNPCRNVGVAMGPLSGLVGLDLDGPDGVALLDRLARRFGTPMPDTLSFRTGGGGGRLLYRLPDGLDPPQRVWTSADGQELVRFQARGGQTVMPPSVHANGNVYEWCDGLGPGQIEPPPCPEWLLNLVKIDRAVWDDQLEGSPPPSTAAGRPDLAQRARLYLDRMGVCDPRPDHPMDASTHLLKAADALAVGFALDDETCVSLLTEWDRANPAGPYPEGEIRRKLAEARRVSRRRPGELAEADGDGPARATSAAAAPGPRPPLRADRPAVSGPEGRAGEGRIPATFTAADLLAEQLPPLRWVVPGLIPEGGLLLAGRPKGGKSWLVLQAALALADNAPVWGHTVAPRVETLYLALEDGKRRLQARLRQLCGDHAPPGLHLQVEWPTLANGAVQHLERWLDDHPAVRLVAIDTLTRVRDRGAKGRGNSSYEIDYDSIAPFTALGQQRGVAVVINHHTRKPKEGEEEDPFDTISGTLGLAGACDTMMVLKRPHAASDAKLHVRGRDVEDFTLTLTWDQEHCLWRVHSGSSLPPEQQKVIDALSKADRPLTPLEAAPLLGKSYEAAKKLLKRMSEAGHLCCDRGRYSCWPSDRGTQGNVPDVPDDRKSRAVKE